MGCASSQPSVNDSNENKPKAVNADASKFIIEKTDVKESFKHEVKAVDAGMEGGNKGVKALLSTVDDSPESLTTSANQETLLAATNVESNSSTAAAAASAARQRQRRAAEGSVAVRDQIRKVLVGVQTKEEKGKAYEVSDSEDEELGAPGDGPKNCQKTPEVADFISKALRGTVVFKGIPEDRLQEVVDRMYGVGFRAGSTVLQQGAKPNSETDCMYVLQVGEAEVVISGAVDQSSNKEEEKRVDGNVVRILQHPGWVFGDIALLFNSVRSASVVAKSDITVWALDHRTFLKFVMQHAGGARALRFLRKVPVLKGLSDNTLIKVGARMPERIFKDDEALIKYGERGDEMFLIRYGKVRVLRPDENGGRMEVAVLGRGQFVGERALINNKMRSADCVAQGDVAAIVMKKKDFLDLDNPVLSMMMDYDAVSSVMKSVAAFKKLKQEVMEQLIDRVDPRQELQRGTVILEQGAPVDRLYTIKSGELSLSQDSEPVSDPTFVREAAGFSFFGDTMTGPVQPSKYRVAVNSDMLQLLTMRRTQMEAFLTSMGSGLVGTENIVAVLKKIRALQVLTDEELLKVVGVAEDLHHVVDQVICNPATSASAATFYLVKFGEVSIKPGSASAVSESGPRHRTSSSLGNLLMPGDVFNSECLQADAPEAIDSSLLANSAATHVLAFPRAKVEEALGVTSYSALLKARTRSTAPLSDIKFADLEFHRIIGTGQFGMVRVVRSITNDKPYALKMMYKAPIVEGKQIEHVINERKILEEARHPFCVRLEGAYQDKTSLYLLQEWVPGGELFHHLDLEGAFDEPTAMFYAASVLLALEFLHERGIVYRDLKPENLLLDTQGYIKVADFGFAKKVNSERTYTICGTPDYQAPEVIMRRGTTKAADYWALGVLIFEMLVGDPPFKSLTGDPWDTFRRALSGRFYVPNFISDAAADLIFKLLQVNPEKRLGSGRNGADDIKRHRWFARMDWAALEGRRMPAPIKPRVRNPLDTSNFDNFDGVDDEPPPVPSKAQQKENVWELWDWIDKQ